MFTSINHLGSSSERRPENTANKVDLSQVVKGSAEIKGIDLPPARQELSVTGKTETESQSQDTKETLNEVVSDLNEFVQTLRRELQFSVDEDTGRSIVTVLNKETDEVVRQIPSEEVLAISSFLKSHAGLLIDTKA